VRDGVGSVQPPARPAGSEPSPAAGSEPPVVTP
jgi:hypothetical protein